MTNNIENTALDVNETISKSEAFVIKYKKAIIAAIVALIVIIAGIALYKAYVSGPRAEKASTALAKGQAYFAQEDFETALNGDKAGYAGFAKIASDYSGTDAANLANLYAGLSNAALGKWKEAVQFLDKYSPSDDALVSPAAVAALGNAYAHVNELDKAVKALNKAADMADDEAEGGVNNSIAPTFRLQAAQIIESQGKKADALKQYTKIKEKYVNSGLVQSQEIDKYIERVAE